jgi:hypothetical protein
MLECTSGHSSVPPLRLCLPPTSPVVPLSSTPFPRPPEMPPRCPPETMSSGPLATPAAPHICLLATPPALSSHSPLFDFRIAFQIQKEPPLYRSRIEELGAFFSARSAAEAQESSAKQILELEGGRSKNSSARPPRGVDWRWWPPQLVPRLDRDSD